MAKTQATFQRSVGRAGDAERARRRASHVIYTVFSTLLVGCSAGSSLAPAVSVARSLGRSHAIADPNNTTSSPAVAGSLSAPVVRTIPRFNSVERDAIVVESNEQRTLVMVDTVRAVITGDGPSATVAIAHERPVREWIAASKRGAGWSFLSADGTAWVADDFLGPLRFVGESTGFPRTPAPSSGALAWVDDELLSWVSDGARVVRWPADATVSVAFADERFGAAVLSDGRVLLTADGGESSRAVSLDTSVAASSVRSHRGSLLLHTSQGLRALARDGAVLPSDAVVAPRSLSHEHAFALLTAVARRWPRSITYGDQSALASSSWAALGRSMLRFDARTGALLSVFRDALPSARCTFVPWGSRVVVRCGEGRFSAVFSPDRGFSRVPWRRESPNLVLSDDGVHAAQSEACESADSHLAHEIPAGLCVLGLDGRWSNVWHHNTRGRVSAMRGALLTVEGYEDRRPTVFVVDADRSVTEPIPFAAAEPIAFDSGITADRTVWQLTSDDELAHLTLIRPRTAPRRVALPSGRLAAIVLNARDALAIGEDIDHFSLTTDGGEHWSPAALHASRGDSHRFDGLLRLCYRGQWRCGEEGCLCGDLWIGRDPPPDGDAIVAPPDAATQRSFTAPVAPFASLQLSCAALSRRASTGDEPIGAEWGSSVVESTALDRSHVSLQIRWRLDGSPSRVHAALAPRVPLERTGAMFDIEPHRGWRVVLANDRFALVERCVSSGVHSACDRFVAREGAARPWSELSQYGPINVWVRRDDGSFVIALAESVDDFRAIAIVDSDGAVTASRALPPSIGSADRHSVAFRGTAAGVLVFERRASPGSQAFVALFDEGRAISPRVERIGLDPTASATLCPARRRAGAITVAATMPSWVTWLDVDPLPDRASDLATTVFELAPNQPPCLRATHSDSPQANDLAALDRTRRARIRAAGALSLRVTSSSSLAGLLYGMTDVSAVRCTLR